MHDFFYQLGFDESAGNFQEINFTGSGFGNDAVLAQAHQQPFNGTATMKTQVDGVRAVMNMGPIAGQDRHSSLDADVVFHEYVHGVTNRLVGGRLNDRALQAPQSRGMGEGWSDYFALTIQNHGKTRERVITGDWLSGRPHGIRMHRYDEHYPSGFGSLGKTPYDREHNIGEIWCAALMQMNRNACKALGGDIGHEICWQLVVDALKLTPANPSFLDGRDALVLALDDMRDRIVDPLPLATHRLLRRALWQAFAKFEMGPGAVSNGASLTGCFPDTNLPHDL
jgi:extracellular elastinolytic metalloproteinase